MGRAQGRFAKEHLVPFGEYVPLQEVLRGLIQFFDLPMSNATPGVAGQPNLQLSMGTASMGICYEVAYADSMRQRTRDAVVMMTLSNDTWFGSSIGPHQHLQIARARALENGRWMLRATNNGITALIDERGRVVAQAPQFEPVVLRGEAQTREGSTPYALMGELWTGLLLVLGAGFILMRRALL